MLWAACTLGFFVFLRSGEFIVVPGRKEGLLSPSDIQVDSRQSPKFISITLRSSKTDPFVAMVVLFTSVVLILRSAQ